MSKINLYNAMGETAGEIDFADELMVLDRGDQAVKDVVVATMNARRAGTASTLSKGEVAGSGKKPWKQKGSGRARAGYRQSPVWRGGGVAMGPKPRDYSVKVNHKVAQLAFRRVASAQIEAGKLVVIEQLEIEDGKTKTMAALLKKLGAQGRVLLVMDRITPAVALASRNLPKVTLVTADNLDVVSLVAARLTVVTRSAFEAVTARMGGSAAGTENDAAAAAGNGVDQ